jgi:RNA polymerase sigma-70 factor (ECF subfamily)
MGIKPAVFQHNRLPGARVLVGVTGLVDFARPETAELDDVDDFAAAVEPHLPLLARVAGRLGPRDSGEDVVQNALLRAWAHRRRYDRRKAPLRTWLVTIVANEARRAAGRRRSMLPIPLTVGVANVAADDRIDLSTATAKLPERQRLAVDCYYYIGLTIAQTAAVMGCSEGYVKSALSDARKHLRLELEKA